MSKSKCPHCGAKLLNFRYADACPHCHEELKENTRPLVVSLKPMSSKPRMWLARAWSRVARFVES
jgi:predicted amidophosphoribosyltransferase